MCAGKTSNVIMLERQKQKLQQVSEHKMRASEQQKKEKHQK